MMKKLLSHLIFLTVPATENGGEMDVRGEDEEQSLS